jgi:hypothetical protein
MPNKGLRVPVLTYHANNISGNEYANNDLVAFSADLKLLSRMKKRIVSLKQVAQWVCGDLPDSEMRGAVALSCDDGSAFDFHDRIHPSHGPQRSLFNRLRDFQKDVGAKVQPGLHLTSFVIASPVARKQLSERCMLGPDWMGDDWWTDAHGSDLIAVESHSWDHVHPEVNLVAQKSNEKGDFQRINSYVEATAQVTAANAWIGNKRGQSGPFLFAYPWGQTSMYLRESFFPQYQLEHQTLAAFGGSEGFVYADSERFALPRFICGFHWKSENELVALLQT